MWVRKNNKHAGATTHTLPDSKWLFMSVRGTQGVIGVVGVPIVGYGVPDAFEKNLMISILSQCGLSMERIRLEAEKNQAALHAQKEHLQAHLLRAVSHDLRTPLTSISGSAGMLMECSGALEEEERQRLYEGIYFDSGWLIDLTENLLAATRLESTQGALKLQPELIEDVFAEALRKLEHRVRKHHISIVMEDPALMARMDTNLILRVVINIINNALQYTPEGSDVVLSARRAGQYAQVSIADNGPGIPREEREHLFDLFYTASQGKGDSHRGMGLGLNLCRTIIKRHNGEIEVLENHPRGTIFRFILPISNETRTN